MDSAEQAADVGFNPRAREGRDGRAERAGIDRRYDVSIHAPARGATRKLAAAHQRPRCFNPRAREGRDARMWRGARRRESFNPRAREGRDTQQTLQEVRARVSIHAPARGATALLFSIASSCGFQSTRPRGARRYNILTTIINEMFQSTRPRGARPPCWKGARCKPSFQSTRPRGARR